MKACIDPINSISCLERRSTRVPALRGVERGLGSYVGGQPVEVLVVGASTGGPVALIEFFKQLKSRAPFPLPVLVVQHMPEFFTQILARTISQKTGWVCREAVHGEVLIPGEIRIAPGDYHLKVTRSKQLILERGPKENYCRPALDPLLRSVADTFGSRALAVVLTGTGMDGMRGAESIVRKGGRVFAQDRESSVCWGMPGSIVEAGLAAEVGRIDRLVDRVKAAVIASSLKGLRVL